MTEFYGSGRFCSKSCANSREHTLESRMKTSASLKGRPSKNSYMSTLDFTQYVDRTKEQYIDGKIRRENLKYYTFDKAEGVDFVCCPYCGNRMSQIQAKHVNLHGKTMKDLREEFGQDYKTVCDNSHKKKSLSSKETQERLIEEGRHKGWQSRKVKSYAEQFWENVLINNNIEYDDEHIIKKRDLGIKNSGNYFLDFLLPGNVDLEIDGKQHTYPDRKEHDIKRDNILKQNGFIIYRIPWVNPINENKTIVKKQIDDFLEWYSSTLNDMEVVENVV